MPTYRVSGDLSGFSCEQGSVAITDGVFETENGQIVNAMLAHGIIVAEVPPAALPEEAAPAEDGRQRRRAVKPVDTPEEA